jgi:C4-type Zn-finger protein
MKGNKCPKCGSTELEPTYEYHFDWENLQLTYTLDCDGCGLTFNDVWSLKHDYCEDMESNKITPI